ncbi:MAG: helix-turn-helix transcriptional regulator [Clostridia bacterium]|nr:helix-turn-helix transcriptional regulator [Clostridia bacterium]
MEIFGEHELTPCPSLVPRGMHSHETCEILLVLSGDVEFRVEGSTYWMKPGDLVLMRRGEVHIPRIRSAVPYERMHVNFDLEDVVGTIGGRELLSVFDDRPLGRWNHYPAALFPENRWQEYLTKLLAAPTASLRLSYLLPLLGDLSAAAPLLREKKESRGADRLQEVLDYVNANLGGELSTELLCRRFFISKTHLNRLFRAATGTTPWEYVTVKRLFLARRLLQEGLRPGEVYGRCGFGDYTTFFRAYKKRFGIGPKG